jgi:hypothetical protein
MSAIDRKHRQAMTYRTTDVRLPLLVVHRVNSWVLAAVDYMVHSRVMMAVDHSLDILVLVAAHRMAVRETLAAKIVVAEVAYDIGLDTKVHPVVALLDSVKSRDKEFEVALHPMEIEVVASAAARHRVMTLHLGSVMASSRTPRNYTTRQNFQARLLASRT